MHRDELALALALNHSVNLGGRTTLDGTIRVGGAGNHVYIAPHGGRFTYRLTWPEIVKLYRADVGCACQE